MQNNLCINCKYYIEKCECKAFPNGILDIILSGESNHEFKLPNQEGDFIFKQIEKKDANI